MTWTTFREHKFRKEGKYKCLCGYKFKRVANTYWTESPFNKNYQDGHPELCNEKCFKELDERLTEQECPKCGLACLNKAVAEKGEDK